MKVWLCTLITAVCLPVPFLAQHSKFVQAELLKTVKAKNAKPGDPVKARAITAVALPGGDTVPQGATLLGQVQAVTPVSLTISFDEVETEGKRKPLNLSIRAAMMPNADSSEGSQRPVGAQAGMVIGMQGVTLQLDVSPQHAARFESSGKDLQLSKGLQFMLALPQ